MHDKKPHHSTGCRCLTHSVSGAVASFELMCGLEGVCDSVMVARECRFATKACGHQSTFHHSTSEVGESRNEHTHHTQPCQHPSAI